MKDPKKNDSAFHSDVQHPEAHLHENHNHDKHNHGKQSHGGHHHCHEIYLRGASLSRIRLAFLLNLSFAILELIGGLWINSIAVLSDALHDFGDALSIGLTYFLERVAGKKRDAQYSYGYRRFSLLAAFLNGVILTAGCAFIIVEALERFRDPVPTQPLALMGMAVVGIIFNGIGVLRLQAGRSLSEKMISWHLLEDIFGWAAILIAGIFMYFYPLPILDPLLAVAFSVFTLWNVYKILRQSITIFLQGIPKDVNIIEIESKLLAIPEVHSVHDIHVWSLDGDFHVMTIHVVLKNGALDGSILKIKQRAREILLENHIEHATIEMEREDECCELKTC